MHIRPYRPSDWSRVCAIWNRAKVDEFGDDIDRRALIPLERDLQMQRLFELSEMFVLEAAEVVQAFGGHEGPVISWLFVDPSAYRRGFGSRMLLHLLGRIRGRAELLVLAHNQPAISLYERFGFSAMASIETSHNGHPVRALKMERPAPRA